MGRAIVRSEGVRPDINKRVRVLASHHIRLLFDHTRSQLMVDFEKVHRELFEVISVTPMLIPISITIIIHESYDVLHDRFKKKSYRKQPLTRTLLPSRWDVLVV